MSTIEKETKASDGKQLVAVCDANALAPGQMRACNVEGLPPLALFNLDGEFMATSNICTHEVALLTDGYFEGEIVECPMHGGSFNVRSGEPKSFPCKERLKTFAVIVKDGQVFVQV